MFSDSTSKKRSKSHNARHFPPLCSKENPKSEQFPTSNGGYAYELYDVLCINCQNYIGTDHIQAHSLICLSSTNDHKPPRDDYLAELSFKFTRLSSCLSNFKLNREISPGDLNSLLVMSRICDRLAFVKSHAQRDINVEALKAIEALARHVKNNFGLEIYVERLRGLAEDQKFALNELDSVADQAKYITLEEQLMYFKNKSQILADALKFARLNCKGTLRHAIEEVLSETSLSNDLHSVKGFESPSIENTSLAEFIAPQLTSSDEKRLFYSQCLSIKLALRRQHHIKNLPIFSIYSKALTLGIPVTHWADFITTEILAKAQPHSRPTWNEAETPMLKLSVN